MVWYIYILNLGVNYESLGENSRGTVKYKKEFKVENELIVGWRDIN